jgi:CDP-glucose 4,6-dehydratase
MNSVFWKGKRVFLTGHTGFKGSWLSLWLQQMGAEVTGYALLPPSTPNLFDLASVAAGMHSIIGDIRDYDGVLSAMQDAAPEIVIHMAAQPLVRYSYENPVETYSVNVMGTVHVLDAVRHVPSVRAVVNVTTDKCYENKEWAWGYRENERLGGHDPYSNSKGCSEMVSMAYQKSFFSPESRVAMATARAGNVIGGGDWAQDRLIPDILAGLIGGEKIAIRYPHATRPWQHVLEPLRGYLMLAEALVLEGRDYAAPWNFGPRDHDVKPVSWIVDRLVSGWGTEAAWYLSGDAHPHEAHALKLDISKAEHQLKWRPVLPLEDALEWILSWYKKRQLGVSARDATLWDIREYQKRI